MASSPTTEIASLADLTIYDFFKYYPSLALAITALVLFVLLAAANSWVTQKTRRWYMYTVGVTGLLEAIGYATLVFMIERTGKVNLYGAYVTFQVLTILPPNLLQAVDYISLGKVLLNSPDIVAGRRWLSSTFISFLFTSSDVLALIIQALGTALWATSKSSLTPSKSKIDLGNYIMLGGLALQLLFFTLFTALTVWVHCHPKNRLRGVKEARRLFLGLYATIVLLFIRNIFRLVEFTQSTILSYPEPKDAFIIAENQAMFYSFDALQILLCLLVFTVLHPGRLLDLPLYIPAGPPAAATDKLEEQQ